MIVNKTSHIVRFDPDGISSREGNEHVPVWNHDIEMVSMDDNRTLYADRVELHAGWKTVFVWLWANLCYATQGRHVQIINLCYATQGRHVQIINLCYATQGCHVQKIKLCDIFSSKLVAQLRFLYRKALKMSHSLNFCTYLF